MALKSSREGLRKELVDYLGNIIIDNNLKQNIINSIDDVFITNEELSEQLLASINILEEKIVNESSARESADSTLQNNINAESTARQRDISNIEDLINNGVLKMDLLWTNASPTSMFPSQTISLDLSNYKNIVVLSYENFSTEARRNQTHTDIVVKNTSSYLSCPNNVAAANTIRWRLCTVSDTSITFGFDDTGDSHYCIPLKIWGVK